MTKRIQEYKKLHDSIYRCTICRERGHFVERVQPKWDPNRRHSDQIKRWGMLIGQAPGISEKKKRRAYRGKAGRGWIKWLLETGFSDGEIKGNFFKTAITKCYPGKKRGGDRKPTKEEIELCSPFLMEQIRLVKPSVIIPMGKTAVCWFFPEVKRLEEVVGQLLKWKQGNLEYDVVCLPHASPVSAWIKREENKVLIRKALFKIRTLFENANGTRDR